MNAIDIFILIILLIGGLNGLRQGFVKAFANLIGWILALILGAKFATVLAPSMVSLSEDPVVQKIAAFAFIVLVIVVRVVNCSDYDARCGILGRNVSILETIQVCTNTFALRAFCDAAFKRSGQ